MDQTAWALLAIRTRARRAEFARLFRRPAGAHDRVVALRTRRHRRWYFMYAASEDRIIYGERYDGPGNGDGDHHRNCALEIARRARGTNRFIFSALRPRRARRRSRTPAPRPPRRRRPPRTRQARTRRAARAARARPAARRRPQSPATAAPSRLPVRIPAPFYCRARGHVGEHARGACTAAPSARTTPTVAPAASRMHAAHAPYTSRNASHASDSVACTERTSASPPSAVHAIATRPSHAMNVTPCCNTVLQHEIFAQKFYRGAVLQHRVATRRAFRRCHSQSMSAKEGET